MLISLLNQAISSLGNFLFVLYLVRVLEPNDFGLYSIGLAVTLAIGSLVQGFLLIQMVVHFPQRELQDHKTFAVSTLGLVIFSWSGLAIIFGFLSLTVAPAWALQDFSKALAILTGAYATKEFFVRYAFLRESEKYQVLLIHGSLVLTLLFGALIFKTDLNAVDATLLYAGSHVTAATVGYILSDLRVGDLRVSAMWDTLRTVAPGGRWAALSSVIYSIRANAHTIIIAASLGTAEVALVNATRTLVTPATLLIPALGNISLPRFSRQFVAGGKIPLFRYARRTTFSILAVAATYCVLLLLAWPFLASAVLSEKYAGGRGLAALWCVYAMTLALRSGMEWTGQAMKLFKKQAQVYLIGALVTLTLVTILTLQFSVSGAISGAIAGELMVITLLFIVLVKAKER